MLQNPQIRKVQDWVLLSMGNLIRCRSKISVHQKCVSFEFDELRQSTYFHEMGCFTV